MSNIRLNIDGREVVGYSGQTILEIARKNKIDIPTLCQDNRLEIYGACGLCVVEIQGSNKLARACATVAADGMVINTRSEKVVASRKVALELLMSDHVGDCRAPCMLACPGNTDCQGYVGLIAIGELDEAIKTIKDQLPMPACIGRVCPHPCETQCRRGLVEDPIAIAQLKYFAADNDLNKDNPYMPEILPDSGKKIAIVGGGPGGLSSGFFLRQRGHDITVYDAMEKMGGMLRYGIPQYRLPKSIVDKEVAIFEQMGIKMVNGVKLGRDISLDYLREEYDAVILAVGAWSSSPLRCKGNDLEGVVGGIDFLRENIINHKFDFGENVAIVGGGNTAMDACRTAIRMGAKKVYNIYRRTKAEMPAEEIEIVEAEEEGVIFKYLVNPIEIIGENGKVKEILLQKMELGEMDASGRRRPVPIEGETELLKVDCVISAIGQKLDAFGLDQIKLTKWNTIEANPHTFLTNLDGVFAIGDATNDGADIAIAAIGEAKRSSSVIHSYLTGKLKPHYKPFYSIKKNVTSKELEYIPKDARRKMPHLSAKNRRSNFKEVNLGFSLKDAREEGMRCLECGCLDVYDCSLIKYSREYNIDPEPIAGEMHHRKEENPHPFIAIDTDKCILCSQCVRTCEEVLGIGALGLVDRGFDSAMKPALYLPLIETGCVSCGQCISVCPTGALQERLNMQKQIPLPPERTFSICDKCSLGCNISLNSKQKKILRVESVKESLVDDGQLCVKGRFGHVDLEKEKIEKPMIKKAGKFVEVEWNDALRYVSDYLKNHELENRSNEIAIGLSPRFTNETAFYAKEFSKKTLFNDNVTTLTGSESVISEFTGLNGSTAKYDELYSTELIVVAAENIMRDYSVMAMKLKKAHKRGVKIATVYSNESVVDDWSSYSFKTVEELESSKLLNEVKSAIIVYDSETIDRKDAYRLVKLSVESGHSTGARKGIIELSSKANLQGFRDMGLLDKKVDIQKSLKNGEIKTLLLFGEDIESELTSKLDFLVVSDVYMTSTAKSADVVLPSVKIENISGTFTNSENRLQFLNRAIDNGDLKAVENILYILSIMLEHKCDYSGIENLTHEIARNIKGYDVLLDEANEYFIERGDTVSLKDYRRRQVKESSRLTGNSIVDNLNKKLRSERIV